jgi:prepilin-type N-terminal cleavage/methylation domain-containing protein/prepilin-type processing-associated H-X9-DG protein
MQTTSNQNEVACPRRPACAFTLVELLVVVGIIAVLASLLLPALAAAKGKARSVVCRSNLKQWELALRFYTDQNGDILPREKPFAHMDPWNISYHTWAIAGAYTNSDVWFNALPPTISRAALADYANSGRWMAFYARESLFHCPTADFPSTNDAYPMFSLAINAKLMRGSIDRGKITDIQEPSRTVAFMEAGLPGEKPVHSGQPYNGQPHGFATRFAARHAGQGNLVFADSHTDSLRGLQVVSSGGMAIFPQTNVVWTVDPESDPNKK